jgi:hypothetical protein
MCIRYSQFWAFAAGYGAGGVVREGVRALQAETMSLSDGGREEVEAVWR